MAKLVIVGLGYTGLSLALALRPSRLFDEIAGCDADRGRLRLARERGAIDQESHSAAEAAAGAAVVVLAVSSAGLEDALANVAPALAPGAVVTDTSRWKAPAQALAERLLGPEAHFAGGRPVLDQAGAGPESASADAFRGALYCLTPSASASQAAVDAVSALASAAGAQPYFLSPEEHDALTAAGELLPPAFVAALVLGLTRDPGWTNAGRLAGPRLREAAQLTRALDGAFWQEAAHNAPALARWLDVAAAALLDLRDRVQAQDPQLSLDWHAAREALDRWQRDKRQLQQPTMPPASELKPRLFGTPLSRRGGRGSG